MSEGSETVELTSETVPAQIHPLAGPIVGYLLVLDGAPGEPLPFWDARPIDVLFAELQAARNRKAGGFFRAGSGFQLAADVRGIWLDLPEEPDESDEDEEPEEPSAEQVEALSTLKFGR